MSSVATAPILVTGATGRQGGTGRHAAAALLDRGLAVRALVRTLDERAESLAALGAEVVVRYQELAPEQWRDELIAGAEATGGANPRGAAHLTAQSVTLRGRPLPPLTDHVERFTGRPATTFTDFVHARREQFAGAVPGA
ncbi:MAG: hypothetical protein JWQ60_1797 [Pseudonocardia sp.]|nr:hypothetical protein [Pseudonocardia sp.]